MKAGSPNNIIHEDIRIFSNHVTKKMADREPPPMDDENSREDDDLFADANEVEMTVKS